MYVPNAFVAAAACKHLLIAAQKISKLKKPSVEAVAAVIAEEFKASAI